MGTNVINAILEFFSSGTLLREPNAIAICLVPKSPNADKMTTFRPISCCNTLYKCICKKDLVSRNQFAFIYGKRIIDNILLGQELARICHWNSLLAGCAMKIVLRKSL